jgi:3-hydroxyacyl-[acyl-carrier-protein] dehydratase
MTESTASSIITASTIKLPIESEEIAKIIPHRYPFVLIDRVVEFEDNKSLKAIKQVTTNEWFFPGHFPGRPVMPGVMILEALAQAAAVLAIVSSDGVEKGKYVYLVGAEGVKWRKRVVPGDTLTLEVHSVKKRRPMWVITGTASVDGKVVAQATLSAAEAE